MRTYWCRKQRKNVSRDLWARNQIKVWDARWDQRYQHKLNHCGPNWGNSKQVMAVKNDTSLPRWTFSSISRNFSSSFFNSSSLIITWCTTCSRSSLLEDVSFVWWILIMLDQQEGKLYVRNVLFFLRKLLRAIIFIKNVMGNVLQVI